VNLNWDNIVANFKLLNTGATGKLFENNLALKMKNAEFLEDIESLLPVSAQYDPNAAYEWLMKEIIPRLKL
jgi:hypothetical protein